MWCVFIAVKWWGETTCVNRSCILEGAFHSVSEPFLSTNGLIHSLLSYNYFHMLYVRLCDEATSALDSTTEASILNSLKSLSVDRTSIFIAHRLTTAMQCDEVWHNYTSMNSNVQSFDDIFT